VGSVPSKEVKRFSGYGISMLSERPDAGYVLGRDYDALLAEAERLRAALLYSWQTEGGVRKDDDVLYDELVSAPGGTVAQIGGAMGESPTPPGVVRGASAGDKS
jgi:hypothetical protein